MNTLIFIVIILLIVIIINSNNCKTRSESFVCLSKEFIPNTIIKYEDVVDTFNCNKSIIRNNPVNNDAYKLTIKINKFRNFTAFSFPKGLEIENNVEYNICGGITNNEITWRLYLKLSPTSNYLNKDIRYDLYLQLNNYDIIYIPYISSINNVPQRGSYQFARSYDVIIYKTINHSYVGVVETLSNNKKLQQSPEYKMDLNTIYNNLIKKSENVEIISCEKFFNSDDAPNPSIKQLGGSSKIIYEEYNSQ